MSDENSSPGEKPVANSAVIRKAILFALLAIMIVALAYDYGFARPAVDAAYKQITDESIRVNADGHEVFTNEDLATLIDKEAAETFRDGFDLVEVYHFTSGIPMKPHKLFAVYKQNSSNEIFYRHAKFGYQPSKELIPIPIPKPIDVSGEDYAELQSEMGSSYGDTPRPTPQERFAERDTDGDGKLTGDEIPGMMVSDMANFDTDEDEAVSMEEMLARMRALQSQASEGSSNQTESSPASEGQSSEDQSSPPKE